MEDSQIIALFFQRSEEAISQADLKYGRYLGSVANRILSHYNENCPETLTPFTFQVMDLKDFSPANL